MTNIKFFEDLVREAAGELCDALDNFQYSEEFEDYCRDYFNTYGETPSETILEIANEIHSESDWSDFLYYFLEDRVWTSGASKVVKFAQNKPYVIKFTMDPETIFQSEGDIYDRAVQAGVENFFAKVYYSTIVDILGTEVSVEVQEKVIQNSLDFSKRSYDRDFKPTHLSKTQTKLISVVQEKIQNQHLTEMLVLHCHPLDVIKLINFIEEEGINDLYDDNWKMRNGRVVLIDYCGYSNY